MPENEKPVYKFTDEDGNDIVEILYDNLSSGKDEIYSIQIADRLNEIIHETEMDEDEKRAIAHIVASVHLWEADDWLDRRTCELFLETDWYDQYPEQIEAFLVMLYSLNGREFVKEMLEDYPFLKEDFPSLHTAYLASIVYPESEEYYNPDHIIYYNKLNNAKRLYG